MNLANSEIIKKLNSINWNFDFNITYESDTLHPFNCRKYFSYPATFIPEIPYALIEILSKKGDVVLDPFGGIGTTFMQALTLEREAFSFDINPVATSVNRTLFILMDPTLDTNKIKINLSSLCDSFDQAIDYIGCIPEHYKILVDWFEPSTFNEMAFLFYKYETHNEGAEKEVLRFIISSVLVTLSSQNKGWAYIADNVKPKADELRKKQVFDQYRLAVKNLINDIGNVKKFLPSSFPIFYQQLQSSCHIINDSFINRSKEIPAIDLIVTSPPYPRMIDYVKSQRLSLAFLGESYLDYVEKEIGARYRRSKRNFLDEYVDSLNMMNKELYSILNQNGFLCVVLPDYEATDNRKESIDKVVEGYLKLGMTKVFEVCRYIPSHKRTLSIQWATLVNEKIYVFQKG